MEKNYLPCAELTAFTTDVKVLMSMSLSMINIVSQVLRSDSISCTLCLRRKQTM